MRETRVDVLGAGRRSVTASFGYADTDTIPKVPGPSTLRPPAVPDQFRERMAMSAGPNDETQPTAIPYVDPTQAAIARELRRIRILLVTVLCFLLVIGAIAVTVGTDISNQLSSIQL